MHNPSNEYTLYWWYDFHDDVIYVNKRRVVCQIMQIDSLFATRSK